MKVLIFSTGNSCRSQMAQGYLQSFDPYLRVYSAGTKIEIPMNENAVRVMSLKGIDISQQSQNCIDKYLNEEWDYVVTLCEEARKSSPTFLGKVKQRVDFDFDDLSCIEGTEAFVESEYIRVRDDIGEQLYRFLIVEVKGSESCPCGANSFCKCE
ncbi:MAG: arsenate reductase ArsC [Bacteroidales bacterium]